MNKLRTTLFVALWVFLVPAISWYLWPEIGPWGMLLSSGVLLLLGILLLPGSSPLDLFLDLSMALLLAIALGAALVISNYYLHEHFQVGEWYLALILLSWTAALPIGVRLVKTGAWENRSWQTKPS